MSELKVQFPPEERPSTAVNIWLNTFLAIAITVISLAAVYQMPTKSFTRDLMLGQKGKGGHGAPAEDAGKPHKETWIESLNLNAERTIFQGLTLLMFYMSAVCVTLKFVSMRREFRLLKKGVIPEDLNMRDMDALIALHAKIMSYKEMGRSILLTRVGRILSMWINTEDFERTLHYAKQENEMDIFVADSSYRANRLYIWAMPLLGFVGTVYGVSYGIGGFADFLRGQVTSDEIKYQVGLITEGLAVAFYCTLLGLLTAGLAAFPSLAAEKKEEEMLGLIDELAEDRLVSRLPSSKVEITKDDIKAMRDGLDRIDINLNSDDLIDAIQKIKIEFPMDEFRDALRNIKIDLPMEKFVAGIKEGMQDLRINVIMPMEDLSRAIDQGFRRLPDPDNYVTVFSRAIAQASDLVTEKYKQFADTYEHRISDLSANFAGKMDEVAGNIRSGNTDAATRMQQQATALAGEFQQAMEKVNHTAEQYSQRVETASRSLAEQMARVNEIAAQIDRLLQASKAMESALVKVSSAEEFGQTLAAIREHLTVNDAFVRRMTRPRRIELVEQIIPSES